MRLGILGIAACGLLSMNAGADVLHDTTGFDFDTTWLVGKSQATETINQPADSILISGGDFFLESLTVRLNASQLIGAVGDDYEVRFWGNDVDRPGSLLETFTIENSGQLDGGDITLFSGGGVMLENGGSYWVSVALPDDLSFGSWQGVDTSSLGRAVAFSGAEDANWIATGSSNALYLQVTGIPVPSPGVLSLVGAGGLMVRRRR